MLPAINAGFVRSTVAGEHTEPGVVTNNKGKGVTEIVSFAVDGINEQVLLMIDQVKTYVPVSGEMKFAKGLVTPPAS